MKTTGLHCNILVSSDSCVILLGGSLEVVFLLLLCQHNYPYFFIEKNTMRVQSCLSTILTFGNKTVVSLEVCFCFSVNFTYLQMKHIQYRFCYLTVTGNEDCQLSKSAGEQRFHNFYKFPRPVCCSAPLLSSQGLS